MGDFEETDWYEVATVGGPDVNKVRFRFKVARVVSAFMFI